MTIATGSVDRLVRAVAAIGLCGESLGSQSLSPTRDEWQQLQGRLVAERMTGLAALLHRSGVLRLDDDSSVELAELDARWSQHTLRAEDVLLSLAESLDTAGIPFRVLKGSALAELDWRWGEARRWVDADVLVPGDRLDEAVHRCLAEGAERLMPELRTGFDRRFAKAVTLRSRHGPEIDLHRALVLGPHTFLVPAADLWSDPRNFVVESAALSTLSAEATLVHTCMHATIAGSSRLASLRDVVEVFAGCRRDAAESVAERWAARPMVVAAAEAVADRLGLSDHPFVAWGRSLQTAPEEERIAVVYEQGNRNNRNMALASVRHVPGLAGKVRYLAALAAPSRANRDRRGWSVRHQIRPPRR